MELKTDLLALKRSDIQVVDSNTIRIKHNEAIRVTLIAYSYMGMQLGRTSGKPFIRLESIVDDKSLQGKDFNGNGLLAVATKVTEFTERVIQIFAKGVRMTLNVPKADIINESGMNSLMYYDTAAVWCFFPHPTFTKYMMQNTATKKVTPLRSMSAMTDKGNSFYRLDGVCKMTEFRLQSNGTISALTFVNTNCLTLLDAGHDLRPKAEPEDRKFQAEKAITESSDFLQTASLTYELKNGSFDLTKELKQKYPTLKMASPSIPEIMEKSDEKLSSKDYESWPPQEYPSRGKSSRGRGKNTNGKRKTPHGASKAAQLKWRTEEEE